MTAREQQQLGWVNLPPADLFNILADLAEPWYDIPYQWDGHGNPGWDCSEWVSYIYGTVYNIDIPGFTDAIYSERDRAGLMGTIMPKIGDIVLYEYRDSGQPGVRFPHVGIYIHDRLVLDSRWPTGVGFNEHVRGAKQYWLTRRRKEDE